MTFSTKTLFILALAFASASGIEAETPSEPVPAEAPQQPLAAARGQTEFESDHAEMQTLETETRFILTGNVKVTGNDLKILCDRLEVYAARGGGSNPTEGLVGPGGIERILAIGNVRIEQEGREATAGQAEVFPQERRIVLTESPVLRDEQGLVSGERITFIQGEGARVERGERGPVRITLPALPDLDTRREPRTGEEPRSVD